MKTTVKIVLCVLLAAFAALSLAAVLGSIGALPASAADGGGEYLLREHGGCIGVFSPAEAAEPAFVTEIRVSALPQADREALREGIFAADRTELMRILEGFAD